MPRSRAATCDNKNETLLRSLAEGSKLGLPLKMQSDTQSSKQNSFMIDSEENKS